MINRKDKGRKPKYWPVPEERLEVPESKMAEMTPDGSELWIPVKVGKKGGMMLCKASDLVAGALDHLEPDVRRSYEIKSFGEVNLSDRIAPRFIRESDSIDAELLPPHPAEALNLGGEPAPEPQPHRNNFRIDNDIVIEAVTQSNYPDRNMEAEAQVAKCGRVLYTGWNDNENASEEVPEIDGEIVDWEGNDQLSDN
jgi:hypothetical protein